ncbi:hypothetical protein SKAU_G00085020 [Synaphobranchus kaupii]|uniref:Uncharacterized protein n=1 Tax=Synaphobranchus kaupii TaxID=118154 RepID=A0A9Q1FW28_SYNKA|nr:hypothetical protein SKAU_G00085020 [Synaphobranchus kaupii]
MYANDSMDLRICRPTRALVRLQQRRNGVKFFRLPIPEGFRRRGELLSLSYEAADGAAPPETQLAGNKTPAFKPATWTRRPGRAGREGSADKTEGAEADLDFSISSQLNARTHKLCLYRCWFDSLKARAKVNCNWLSPCKRGLFVEQACGDRVEICDCECLCDGISAESRGPFDGAETNTGRPETVLGLPRRTRREPRIASSARRKIPDGPPPASSAPGEMRRPRPDAIFNSVPHERERPPRRDAGKRHKKKNKTGRGTKAQSNVSSLKLSLPEHRNSTDHSPIMEGKIRKPDLNSEAVGSVWRDPVLRSSEWSGPRRSPLSRTAGRRDVPVDLALLLILTTPISCAKSPGPASEAWLSQERGPARPGRATEVQLFISPGRRAEGQGSTRGVGGKPFGREAI